MTTPVLGAVRQRTSRYRRKAPSTKRAACRTRAGIGGVRAGADRRVHSGPYGSLEAAPPYRPSAPLPPMALTVPARAERSLRMPVPRARAWELLLDIPLWTALFPRVDSVEPLAEPSDAPGDLGAWRWTMEPLGPPGLEMVTAYGCRYTADADAHRLTWAPVDGVGNARFAGQAALTAAGDACDLALALDGELSIPAPRLLRGVVEKAVEFEFRRTLDTFLERIADELADGAAGSV